MFVSMTIGGLMTGLGVAVGGGIGVGLGMATYLTKKTVEKYNNKNSKLRRIVEIVRESEQDIEAYAADAAGQNPASGKEQTNQNK